jgi:hypothetical protein
MTLIKRKPSYYKKHFWKYVNRMVLKLAPSHKPNFMIIGAQKAATTSLYNYLDQLPEFRGSLNKETYYFNQEVDYGRSLNWYHSLFKYFSYSSATQFFEATPEYFYFPWVPERLYNYNSNLKLIVILRDPIARAYSAWKMYANFFKNKELYRVKRGLKPGEKNYWAEYCFNNRLSFPSFEECIDIELKIIENNPEIWEPSLLRRGLYYDQIQRFAQYFSREQLLIVGFKDLVDNPDVELKRIYEFLTGTTMVYDNAVLHKRNSLTSASKMPEIIRERLVEYYFESNQKLFAYLGHKLNW